MDEGFNVTYLTLDKFVELDKYRYLYFVIMFTAYVLIICSNSIIVYLIWTHPNLHEPMYIFIAALLINSVLFSSAVYPKLLMDFISDRQIISYPACLCQSFIFYSSAGSEFLLLAAMAYDRYVSISKPLQYPTIMSRSTVSVFLSLAWVLPVCQLVGAAALHTQRKLCYFTLKGIYCNSVLYKLYCSSSLVLSVYGLIGLLYIDFLPLLFILFTYTRIFIICYRSSRDVRRKAAQTCLPHLIVLINVACFFAYDIITARLEFDLSKTVYYIMTLQVLLYSPLLNPVIYGLKMKEIKKHLKQLFSTRNSCCQPTCETFHKPVRSSRDQRQRCVRIHNRKSNICLTEHRVSGFALRY